MNDNIPNFANAAPLRASIFLLPNDFNFHLPRSCISQCIFYCPIKKWDRQFRDKVHQDLCAGLTYNRKQRKVRERDVHRLGWIWTLNQYAGIVSWSEYSPSVSTLRPLGSQASTTPFSRSKWSFQSVNGSELSTSMRGNGFDFDTSGISVPLSCKVDSEDEPEERPVSSGFIIAFWTEYGAGPGDGKGSSQGSKTSAWVVGILGYSLAGGGFDKRENYTKIKTTSVIEGCGQMDWPQ